MGISTGYGRAITSGSVFAFDTADVINSYKGEPTTNLIPSPELNAYPTFGNGWGTYNTNQYCGNNGCAVYWDIPAITFVSGDVITTAANHPIRSFDVIRPETTGGGVTAGTDYVAKKITNTQFSLHAYNSSQDGSQGYINSATGGHKVHDSYWLDQKVSVNATSFPTKWWGAPHLPNSAIVKEIIPNGFTRIDGRKTDCIRLHWSRPDGVTDGMAYGVDAPLTIGVPVTVSFYARAVDASAVGQSIYFQNYNYGGIGGYSQYAMTVTWGAAGEWVRNSYTFTPTHAAIISYWFPSTGNMKVDIANIQVEHKTHATPFTISNRSNTNAIAPLAGNSTIDLSNMSFDTNAQMYFDGTNDFIDTDFPAMTINNPTMEAVVYRDTNTGRYEAIIQNNVASDDALYVYPGGTLGFWPCSVSSLPVPVGQWNYVAVSYNGSSLTYCVNGVIEVLAASCADITDWDFLRIGAHGAGDGERWIGKIAVAKVYDRALSIAELKQNYNKYKTRFKLS